MAFGGAASVQALGPLMVRITGLSLARNSSGTIGLSGDKGADVARPSSFPRAGDGGFSLSQLVMVHHNRASQAGTEATHLHIDKSEGPFRVTFSNDTNQDTAGLEIYMHYIHSMYR